MKNPKILAAILVILASLVLPEIAQTSTLQQINAGFAQTGQDAGFAPQNGAPRRTFEEALATYVSGMVTIMSALFMILIIYGGWLWMTAMGKEEQIQKAQKIIIGATIGLVIIISARLVAEIAITYLDKATINR
ncbi:MAG: hypothetical protein RB292_04330 [Patescibacteria group bacterium]|jgi:hypothetical protein|nr:hypothetical protein [Patescibacteria group bacterium]